MAMYQNVMYYVGEGDFIMFDEIPILTIKLPERQFQTFPDIPCSRSLSDCCAAPIINHS